MPSLANQIDYSKLILPPNLVLSNSDNAYQNPTIAIKILKNKYLTILNLISLSKSSTKSSIYKTKKPSQGRLFQHI